MVIRSDLESLFEKHGVSDYRWLDPKAIVVSQWVRVKCMFGCGDYGRRACCPPNMPSVAECRQFFDEYSTAAIFHFEKAVAGPEDRHVWGQAINDGLMKLERNVFLAGHERAFLLLMACCSLCAECENPKLARPVPEALAVDVYSTARQYGYPIHVLSGYAQTMHRYAFIMIE
jgi:predicted metal-binding protein